MALYKFRIVIIIIIIIIIIIKQQATVRIQL